MIPTKTGLRNIAADMALCPAGIPISVYIFVASPRKNVNEADSDNTIMEMRVAHHELIRRR